MLSHVVYVKTKKLHQVLGFFLSSDYSGTKPTPILIVHQIPMRFFKV